MPYAACAFERLEAGKDPVGFCRLPSDINRVLITVEGAPCRVRFDGGAPNTAQGHLLSAGDYLLLESTEDVVHFRVMSTDCTVIQATGYRG